MRRISALSVILIPMLLNAMSVTEAIQKSVSSHPQIQMKKEDHLVQKELLGKVKAGYLPSIDLSYSVGPEVTYTINNERERENLKRQGASATLTQNIFAGFETVNGVSQQKALILSAAGSVKDSANELALATAS